jgi:hypothetical protein
MLPRFAVLLFVLLAAKLVAQVEFVRVWPSYRTADSFVRLAEYFGAPESPVVDTLLRSQPTNRAGYYWLVRTRAAAAQPGARYELALVPPGATAPVTYTFAHDLAAGNHVTQLGLTGTDWPDPAARPLAWRVTLLDAGNTILATRQSFLWRDPPAP